MNNDYVLDIKDFYSYKNSPLFSLEWWIYTTATSIKGTEEHIKKVAQACFEKEGTCVWHENSLILGTKCRCANCERTKS